MGSTATRSGHPAKKAAAKKTASAKKAAASKKTSAPPRRTQPAGPSSVADFKKQVQGLLLPLPSGLVMTVRRIELQNYLNSGQGEIFNPLMGIVGEALDKGGMIDVEKAVGVDGDQVDLDKLRDMYEMVNGIVIEMSISPKVHAVPENPEDRSDEELYVDEMSEEDKMFLFQWSIGGTDDIATFRKEAGESMAALAESAGRSRKTK